MRNVEPVKCNFFMDSTDYIVFFQCRQCIGQQDPYCSWNDRQHKCSARGNPNLFSCTQRTHRL